MNTADAPISESDAETRTLTHQVRERITALSEAIVEDVLCQVKDGLTKQVALLTIENQELRARNQAFLDG